MLNKYKLSIIIPHYNTPELLEKLLATIPENDEIQIIVVDDHSSEEAKRKLYKIKASLCSRKILFLRNDTAEHNAGKARNIGLEQAEGDWLLFADADDFFLEGFYESIKKYFDSNYDIIYFSPISIDLDTREYTNKAQSYFNYIEFYLKDPSEFTEANLRYRWYAPWSKLIRRSLVQKERITFDSINVANDLMFSTKIGAFADKITVDKSNIYCVTSRKGSLTTKYDLKTFEIRTNTYVDQFHFLENHVTKNELKAIQEYKIPLLQLQLILRRRYGINIFFKYLKIFLDNNMLIFDVRIFTCIRPWRWLRARRLERETRKQYEISEDEKAESK